MRTPPSPLRSLRSDPEVVQLEAGLRQVIKRERVSLDAVESIAARLQARGLTVRWDPAWQYDGAPRDLLDFDGGGSTSLFVARDAGAAEEALALSRAEATRDADHASLSARLGELLGYPECCVAAWVGGVNTPTSPRGSAGIYLDAWQATHRPFDPRLNRLGAGLRAISHRPCRFDCEHSGALAEATLERLEAVEPGTRAAFLQEASRPLVLWSSERWRAFSGAWEGDCFEFTSWDGPPDPHLDPLDAALEEADALRWRPGALELRAVGAWRTVGEVAPLELPWLFPFGGGPLCNRPGSVQIGARIGGGPIRLDRALLVGDLRRHGLDATLMDRSDPSPEGLPPDERGVTARRERLAAALGQLFGVTPGPTAPGLAPGPLDPVRGLDGGERLRGIDLGVEGEGDRGLGPVWPVPGWSGDPLDPTLLGALTDARRHLSGLQWVGLTAPDRWPALPRFIEALRRIELPRVTLVLRGTPEGVLQSEALLRGLTGGAEGEPGVRIVVHGLALDRSPVAAGALRLLRSLHVEAPWRFDPFAAAGWDRGGFEDPRVDPDELFALPADPTAALLGPPARVVDQLGPLRVGEALGQRWRIDRIVSGRRDRLRLRAGAAGVVLRVDAGGGVVAEDGPPRPAQLLADVVAQLLQEERR